MAFTRPGVVLLIVSLLGGSILPVQAQATVCTSALPDAPSAEDYLTRAQACWNLVGIPSHVEPEIVLRLVIGHTSDALSLDPTLAEAYSLRGHARMVAGLRGQALADFTLALYLNPSANTYILRAIAMQGVGDTNGAIADYDAAIALAPEDGAGYAARGRFYLLRENWDAALADFEQVLLLEPENADAYAAIGEIHDANDRPAEALAAYERHLEVATHPSPVVNAWVLLLRRELSD
jgi:tetratricopeptide (TPR) repeat protein